MQQNDYNLENEKKLVELAKRDPEAFGRLYELNYEKILNYVLRRTANIQLAQDITAETFFKALKCLHGFTWNNIPFSAWLFKIATNEINAYLRKGRFSSASLDELRDKGFEPISEQDIEQELISAQQELEMYEQYLMVREKIENMPQKYREVLALRFFADKQLSEIAQILGKPEGTVKSLLHRGLEKIKKELSTYATFEQKKHY